MQLTEERLNQQQRVEQTLHQIRQAGSAALRKIDTFCRELYRRLAGELRLVIDYVSPPVRDADETESLWIMRGAVSMLRSIEGEDPVEAFCRMAPSARQEALARIAEEYASLLGVPACGFQVSDQLPANVMGAYSRKRNCITINAALVLDQPITPEVARGAVMTIIHEMFHAYQYVVMYQPHKYGIPEEVAAYWRENARNYCTPGQNPAYYHLQPLESYARYVEEGVMEWLRDPDAVNQLRTYMNNQQGG